MEGKKETKQGNRHILIMILCCLVPMLLVALLLTVGVGGVLPFLVILMCPLMHFIMMRGMMHGGHNHKYSDHHVINTKTSAKGLEQTDNATERSSPQDEVNLE